jgi:SAM-dependent MidA family methyltransferase
VGYGEETDFFTASTSGAVFGELVSASCASLLAGHGADPGDFHFVEIGAESAGGILAGVKHPFARASVIKLGDALSFSGRCVVFSNELFDAQPCRSFVRRGPAWLEIGVGEKDGALVEVELGPVTAPWLPSECAEGYRFDAPRAAADFAGLIARQPWTGLFVAMDYGKSHAELAESCPEGTLRAYHRHTQGNDLLSCPGEQDLTCHVCWDWIRSALDSAGFGSVRLESQEAFFVEHAGDFIARSIAAEAERLSRRKLSLLQLLHPAHLGQKFQALHAYR